MIKYKLKNIEAVTVCVGLSNFLIQIVENLKHFKKWNVVTIEDDYDTQAVCEKHNINTVISNRSGLPQVFKKGCLINDGLNMIKKKDWILILDCDILLPNYFKQYINNFPLNKECLYGCNRINLDNINKKENLMEMREIWGYFQLFHSSKIKPYPETSDNCAFDDGKFMRYWNKKYRQPLPIDVMHYGPATNEHSPERWNASGVMKNIFKKII